MIDFHNHILPTVDDGASSLDISISMLQHAQKQGITDVVNTVHFQHPKMEGKKMSFKFIKGQIDELNDILKNNNIKINIHIGSEVFFLPNLLDLIDNPLSTIGNGKYMLIEFNPFNIPDIHKQIFFDLKMNGITPIIAHPERYNQVQENINIVADWLEAGCIVQIDAGSPIGLLGKKAKVTSEILIKNNWFQLLGSDAHDNRNRNFCLKESISYIDSIVDFDLSHLVIENPKKIIQGEPINFDVNHQNYNNNVNSLEKVKNFFKKKL